MSALQDKIDLLKKHVKEYPDFPKPGILFRDMFSIFLEPKLSRVLKDVLIQIAKEITPKIDAVVALDARGFLLAPFISLELNIPFVPIRKQGKLPGQVLSESYDKEYGTDTLQIQAESIKPGQNVLVVDDLLATGGSLGAACKLVKGLQGKVVSCLVLMELEDLKGRENVPAPVRTIITF